MNQNVEFVIPAKAGIQRRASARLKAFFFLKIDSGVSSLLCSLSRALDSRFRGNDCVGKMGIQKLALLALVLVLAACASDKGDTTKEKPAPKAEIKTENLICPQVAILQDVQETFDYAGEKPAPAQLVAKARMRKIDGDCAYHKKDDKGGSGIDILFTLHQVAERGPRLGGAQASFPYFIAVVDPAENILSRQLITAQFKFSGSNKDAALDEPLHVFIPLPEESLQAGPDYRVLVGFKQVKN